MILQHDRKDESSYKIKSNDLNVMELAESNEVESGNPIKKSQIHTDAIHKKEELGSCLSNNPSEVKNSYLTVVHRYSLLELFIPTNYFLCVGLQEHTCFINMRLHGY